MASTSVTFDILARDHASSALNKIGGSATNTGSKFSKMAKVAGVATLALGAGAVLAGKALFDMGKNALEDENAQRRLKIALENSTGATDKQVASVEKWISAQGVALGVTDDELRPAIQRLVQATGDVGKAQHLANIAMDVSAGSGKTLKQVTEALTKAQLGSVGGLARLGAKTKDAKGETLSLQEVTKSLADTYKGQAAKAAETATGKFDRLKLMFDETKEAIGRRLIPIASALAGFLLEKAIPAFDKFGGKIREVAGKIRDFADKLHLPGLASKVKAAFSKIDIGNIGKKLGKQAEKWAGPVIDGFKKGLDTGDWSGLGEALGNGVLDALDGIAALSGKITEKFGDMMGKVDWVGVGLAVGKQAPSLLVGIAAGILNFDLFGLLKGLAKHWQDILLAILAVAFTPGKIVGKVAELLARIPLAGRLLSWGLLAFKKFSDGIARAIGKAIAFMGREFLAGFRKVFPSTGKKFAEWLAIFPTRVGVAAIKVADKAKAMVRGLGTAIAKGVGFVASKIGELIANILKPWVNANTWLVKKGVDILAGLIRGIGSKMKDVLGLARSIGGKIKTAVGNLGSILADAGRAVIEGLWGGISSKLSWLGGKLGGVGGFIKDHKGPIEKDRELLRPAGRAIMDGLMAGIADRSLGLQTALGKVTGLIETMRDRISAAMDKISNLQGIRSGFAGTFSADSIFGTDGTVTTQDAEGNDVTRRSTVADLIAFQQKEARQAHRLARDIKDVTKRGLSKALIRQLQSQGAEGAAALHEIAQGSKQDIQRLNRLNKQTSDSLKTAGLRAGNFVRGGSIDKDIRVAQKQERTLERQEDILKRLEHHLQEIAHSQKKDQTIVVEIDGQAVVTAVRRTTHNKGKKSNV